MSWSTDTFAHVQRALDGVAGAVQSARDLVALGPDLAEPEAVRAAGQNIEDALSVLWGPVLWDAPVEVEP